MQFGQRTTTVTGSHVRDELPDGRAANVLGRAALGDAECLIPLVETALLAVRASGLDPESSPSLGGGNMPSHERARRLQGEPGVPEGHCGADAVEADVRRTEVGPASDRSSVTKRDTSLAFVKKSRVAERSPALLAAVTPRRRRVILFDQI